VLLPKKGRVFQQHPFQMIIASSGNQAITWNRRKLFWLRNQITQGETTTTTTITTAIMKYML